MSAKATIPGVNNAVQKLEELADRMRSEDFGFRDNDVDNIDKVIDALYELETERRQIHDELEKQTINSSILRHRLKVLPGQIRDEIMEAVMSARLSNANVLLELQEKLKGMTATITALEKRARELEQENAVLHPERELLKQQHEEIISQLNQRMAEKASMQIALNETRDKVRQANQDIVDLEDGILQLKEDLIQERTEARQEKKRLKRAVTDTTQKTKEQKDQNVTKKIELDHAQEKLMDSEGKLDTVRKSIRRFETSRAKLEGEERALAAQLSKQLKMNDQMRIKGTEIMNKRIEEERRSRETLKELEDRIKKFQFDIDSESFRQQELGQKKVQLLSDLAAKEEVMAEDAVRVEELDTTLQASKEALNTKAEEVGSMKRENIDMSEEIEILAESHKYVHILAQIKAEMKADEEECGKFEYHDSESDEAESDEAKSDKVKPGEDKADEDKDDKVKAGEEKADKVKADEDKDDEDKDDKVKADKMMDDKVKVCADKDDEVKAGEDKDDKVKDDKVKDDKVKADEDKADKVKAGEVKDDKVKADEDRADKVKADEDKDDKIKADEEKDDKVKAGEDKDDKVKAGEEKADKVKADEDKDDGIKADKVKADEDKDDKVKADEDKDDKVKAGEDKDDKVKAGEDKDDKVKADEDRADKVKADEDKADEDKDDKVKAGEDRADEDKDDDIVKAGEDKADEDRADKVKAGEDKADEDKDDKVKAGEDKVDEDKDDDIVKAGEDKADEDKDDKVKADEDKADEDKDDKVKADEDKADEVKDDKVKANGVKVNEVKADEVKDNEVKADGVKEDGVKADGGKDDGDKDNGGKPDGDKDDGGKADEVKVKDDASRASVSQEGSTDFPPLPDDYVFYPAVLAQLNKQIEEYREQLSRERKERMEIQSLKDSVSKSLDDLKTENQFFMTEMTNVVQGGKKQHQELSNEGMQLQKTLKETEEEIEVLSENLEQAQQKYQTMFDDYQKRTDTIEEEMSLMEENLRKILEEQEHLKSALLRSQTAVQKLSSEMESDSSSSTEELSLTSVVSLEDIDTLLSMTSEERELSAEQELQRRSGSSLDESDVERMSSEERLELWKSFIAAELGVLQEDSLSSQREVGISMDDTITMLNMTTEEKVILREALAKGWTPHQAISFVSLSSNEKKEVLSLEASLEEKKHKLDEQMPVFEELEVYFKQRNEEYDNMKKTIGELRKRKQSLEDQIKRIIKDKEMIKQPLGDLRSNLKTKRQKLMLQMQTHGKSTQEMEQQILTAGCKLRTVVEENFRFNEKCKKMEEDLANLQKDMDENERIKARLQDELSNQKQDLMKKWEADNMMQEFFASRDEATAEAFGRLLSRTEKRENKIDMITERLKEELHVLGGFLDNISNRRPQGPKRKVRAQGAARGEKHHTRQSRRSRSRSQSGERGKSREARHRSLTPDSNRSRQQSKSPQRSSTDPLSKEPTQLSSRHTTQSTWYTT